MRVLAGIIALALVLPGAASAQPTDPNTDAAAADLIRSCGREIRAFVLSRDANANLREPVGGMLPHFMRQIWVNDVVTQRILLDNMRQTVASKYVSPLRLPEYRMVICIAARRLQQLGHDTPPK